MLRNFITILPLLVWATSSFSQVQSDTTKKIDNKKKVEKVDDWTLDSTIDYDLLLQDMETFLDSISMPHSYLLGSVAVGSKSHQEV